MNGDAPDLKRFFQTHIGPRFAGVGGFINAIAPAHGVARVMFAGAHPNYFRVTARHRHIADGHCGLLFKNRREGRAIVGGLE